MKENDAEKEIKEAIISGHFLHAVFSSPAEKQEIKKVEIRPLLIKEKLHYQVTNYQGQKALHQNLLPKETQDLIFESCLEKFKQALISLNTTDYQILMSKNKKRTFLKKASSKKKLELLSHNRKKNYLMDERSLPFLVELGLMSKNGEIIAKKSDKYRQLNRFLEMVEDICPSLSHEKPIHIVDFGCGKAYLTFALYHYLHEIKGYSIKITGLDLKKDVVTKCQALAKKLKFDDLQFLEGDISHYETNEPVDMMVTLHACDTATDAALEKAILWKTTIILSVPCCQHELYGQVKNKALSPLLKHGILKERFSSLVTDAARAQILEIMGYQTQILEFIDMEHTPKNLLIRAIKRQKNNNREKLLEEYQILKEELNIDPFLEKRLKSFF